MHHFYQGALGLTDLCENWWRVDLWDGIQQCNLCTWLPMMHYGTMHKLLSWFESSAFMDYVLRVSLLLLFLLQSKQASPSCMSMPLTVTILQLSMHSCLTAFSIIFPTLMMKCFSRLIMQLEQSHQAGKVGQKILVCKEQA